MSVFKDRKHMFSAKKLVEEIDRQCDEDPKRGYSGPIPVISYDMNCINACQEIDAMNKIERLASEGWIDLRKSYVLLEEIDANSCRVSKSCETVSVGGEELTASEEARLSELRDLLFGNKTTLSVRDERDVRHIFDHKKYTGGHQWRFFVTNDRNHILSKKSELAELGINVGTPEECVLWLEPILPELKDRIRRYHQRDISHRAGENSEFSAKVSDVNYKNLRYDHPEPASLVLKAMDLVPAESLMFEGEIWLWSNKHYQDDENEKIRDVEEGVGVLNYNGNPGYSEGIMNSYLWCTSQNKITPSELALKFNRDAVVHINEPEVFAKRLLEAAYRSGGQWSLDCRPVSYDKRSLRNWNPSGDGDEDPDFYLFQKAPAFSHEKEYRFVLTSLDISSCEKELVILQMEPCSDIMTLSKVWKK